MMSNEHGMNVLVWNPLWGAQGNIEFFKNCFLKHLNKQAVLLSKKNNVTVIIPEWFDVGEFNKENSVNYRVVSSDVSDKLGAFEKDITKLIYTDNEEGKEINVRIKSELEKILPTDVDVVLVWENPVPFLKDMYPNALIINQMPGFFSRPPYPHTVCFEPYGLYKDSLLFKSPRDVFEKYPRGSVCAKSFKELVKAQIRISNPVRPSDINLNKDKLALLPLQTSDHYSFYNDYNGKGQLSLLVETLKKKSSDENLLVTQYVSAHAQDKVLTESLVQGLDKKWSGLLYNKEFDNIPSVSQYLLQYVERVYCFSSSLAIQAFAWDIDVKVHEDSYLSPIVKEMHEELNKDVLLSFVLSYYQPLANKVLHDEHFLNELLLKMLERKRLGNDLLVDFSDIDPSYNEALLKSFRLDASLKSLGKSDEIAQAKNKDYMKFKRAIENDSCKVVSFDVFDTLLERFVEAPADVYQFLETLLVQKYGDIYDGYAKNRLNAELLARRNCVEGEITIYDIYSHIADAYQLDEVERNKLIEEEVRLEESFLRPRPLGKKLWDLAKSIGKPIVIVSDMYHTHSVVESFLLKNGYDDYDKLYVSSSFNTRKKTGTLYPVVFNDIKSRLGEISKEDVLHIGDNKEADIDQASSFGFKAMRTPRSLDRMRQNEHFKKIYPPRIGAGEKSRSIIAGLTSGRLFDENGGIYERNTLFSGSVDRLGYAGIGPFIYGFAKWLNQKVKSDGCDRVYFLSREGWILKEAYDLVSKDDPASPPSTYLYSSRRASRVAAIKSSRDIYSVAAQPFTDGSLLSKLLESRFGLDVNKLPLSALNNTSFKSYDAVLKSNLETKAQFGTLCRTLESQILQKASSERLPYLNYLSSIGLSTSAKPAIVDIGWKANMQGALGKLMHRSLNGYYYSSLSGVDRWIAEGHNISSYYVDNAVQNNKDAILNNRHIVESLICCADKSFVRMEQVGASFYPVFKSEENYLQRKSLIDSLHSSALEFVKDAVSAFSSVSTHLVPDPALSNACLSYFLSFPAPQDVNILKNLVFEDSFGGVNSKAIVSEKSDDSVWKVGVEALSENDKGKKPQSQNIVSPKVLVSKQESGSVESGFLMAKVEPFLIKKVTSEKEFKKYLRSREKFFSDSKSMFLKKWFELTGGK